MGRFNSPPHAVGRSAPPAGPGGDVPLASPRSGEVGPACGAGWGGSTRLPTQWGGRPRLRGRVRRFNCRKPPKPYRAGLLCNTSPTAEQGMDKTELGRAGELAMGLYSIVSSDGDLQLFTPVADDDHVDATAGRRSGMPAIAIQVKTATRDFGLLRSRLARGCSP